MMAANRPSSSHEIRDSHYYGGDLRLSREEGDEDAQAVLIWGAFQGGTVTLELDYWELGRLAAACEQLRDEMRADLPWVVQE